MVVDSKQQAGGVRVVKRFLCGRKAKSVELLSTNLVRKTYDPKLPNHVRRFYHEVALLRHLQGCPFVPTLASVNEEQLSFKMSYCGKLLRNTPQARKLIDKLLHALERDYGVVRRENMGRGVHRLGTSLNACIDGAGNVFLIDFGSSAWLHLAAHKPPASGLLPPKQSRIVPAPPLAQRE